MNNYIRNSLLCWVVLFGSHFACVGAEDDMCSPRSIKKAMTQVCALHRRSIRLVNLIGPLQAHGILPEYFVYGGADEEMDLDDGVKSKRSVDNDDFRKHGRRDSGEFRRLRRSVDCPYGVSCGDMASDLAELIAKEEFDLTMRRRRSRRRELLDHSWMVKYLEGEETPRHIQLAILDPALQEDNVENSYSYTSSNPWLTYGDINVNRIMKNQNTHKISEHSEPALESFEPNIYSSDLDNERFLAPSRSVWSSSDDSLRTESKTSRDPGYLRRPMEDLQVFQSRDPGYLRRPTEDLQVLRKSKRSGGAEGRNRRTLRDIRVQCCLQGCTLEDWVSGC